MGDLFTKKRGQELAICIDIYSKIRDVPHQNSKETVFTP